VAQSAASPTAAASLRKLINVNTAGQGELELLPGIGPALAKRIIDHRAAKGAFKRVDDLDAVKGIGPKILGRLRPQVCVE
jgi:competence protein ComEA